MGLFTTLAACAALSLGVTSEGTPAVSQQECHRAAVAYQTALQALVLSKQERDVIARVAYAEAANQGDSGLAGVVYTILNRLLSGQFGGSISAIVNAPHQFEPVTRAGGWQRLPRPSPTQRAKIDTVINLALEGHLPDLTHGALFFQNPAIVSNREKDGKVSEGMTHFGGATPSAVIRNHAFYPQINNASDQSPVRVTAKKRSSPKKWDVYRHGQAQVIKETAAWDVFAQGDLGESILVGDQE